MTGVSLVESEVLYKNMDHSDGLHINIASNKCLFFFFKVTATQEKRFEEKGNILKITLSSCPFLANP